MNYAEIKYNDIANGPGVRVSLFVSGCTHHCKGCFNAETWDFNYGKKFDESVSEKIFDSLNRDQISGLTILGGEPFEPENSKVLNDFVKNARKRFPEKSIWCFSGYRFEELLNDRMHGYRNTVGLLSGIDVLVDGEFVEELKNLRLVFRGSSNQRILDIPKSLEQNKPILWHE